MGRPRGDTRERILDAAFGLMRDSGTARFSQTEVARLAGVPQGHLTYYFPRRTDLVLGVAGRFIEASVEALQDFVGRASTNGRHATPVGAVLDFAATMVRDRARTRLLLALVLEAEAIPALRAELRDSVRLIRDGFAGALRLNPADPQVELLMASLWGLGIQELIDQRRSGTRLRALLERLGETTTVGDAAPDKGAAPRRRPRRTGKSSSR